MKSLAELQQIRDQFHGDVSIRQDNHDKIKVEIGMATCGIAAGAREVVTAVMDELSKETVQNVVVTQTGCMGICQYEPIVEVFVPGKEKVTYVKVTPEKARRIIKEHVAGGTLVTEYTIGANA